MHKVIIILQMAKLLGFENVNFKGISKKQLV